MYETKLSFAFMLLPLLAFKTANRCKAKIALGW
jgi:hypothetical protein